MIREAIVHSSCLLIVTGNRDDKVVELITQHQTALYAYIVSLVYRGQDAHDVLQETNMVLWDKRLNAPVTEEFITWACSVAHYQVLSYRKRHQRSRLFFSEDLIVDLAAAATTGPAVDEAKFDSLHRCIDRLPERSRQLLKKRYFTSQSVEEIASDAQKSAAAVSQALYRIRKQLLDCIQARMFSIEGKGQ